MKPFEFGQRQYDYLHPYIIAEIGVNHEGDVARAKRMIEAVARAGGHAAKFQTYKAETLATADDSPSYWDRAEEPAESQFQLFKRWDTFGPDEYMALASHCDACGIDFLSTPFDLAAVDLLASAVPLIKIASADVTNLPLLRKVAATGLPVIMSTGASTHDEVRIAIDNLRRHGANSVTLLHCVLNYPTAPANAQLGQIRVLDEVYGGECAIGYSDHVKPDASGGMPALELATLMGATVLEKHFTDDKSLPGNDHYHAMDEHDLAGFNERLVVFRTLYGSGARNLEIESAAISNARRRIAAARDIAAGEQLSESNLIALRSNRGIEISNWDEVIGRQLSGAVKKGVPLEWKDVS